MFRNSKYQSRFWGPSGPFFFDRLTLKMEPKCRPETTVNYHQQELCEQPRRANTWTTWRRKPQISQIIQGCRPKYDASASVPRKARNWTEDKCVSCKQIPTATLSNKNIRLRNDVRHYHCDTQLEWNEKARIVTIKHLTISTNNEMLACVKCIRVGQVKTEKRNVILCKVLG